MIGACQPVSLAAGMQVWWVDGGAGFPIWNYDPVHNVYTPVSPGIDAGLATVTAGPNTAFSILGEPALEGLAGAVQAETFSEYGGTGGGAGVAQLQFYIGNARVASLSTGWLKVTSITEGAPAAGNVFQIYNGGLVGVLGTTGLLAVEILEWAA